MMIIIIPLNSYLITYKLKNPKGQLWGEHDDDDDGDELV
jgi:hypothetical protein